MIEQGCARFRKIDLLDLDCQARERFITLRSVCPPWVGLMAPGTDNGKHATHAPQRASTLTARAKKSLAFISPVSPCVWDATSRLEL